MMVQIFWLATFMVAALAQERNDQGILRLSDGCTVAPWSRTCLYTSHEFPSPAPHLMKQNGRYVCHKAPDTASIMFQCPVIDIPKKADGTCETKFILEDLKSRKQTTYCGKYTNLTILPHSQDVYVQLITTERGGGLVNCTVDCVWVSPAGEVEYPTPLPYLTHEFEEDDSSEHGSYPGPVGTTCPCGNANKMTSRIVNGTETLRNEFPFIAALVEANSLWRFCGSPIITPYHTLTAAHCTDRYLTNNKELAVILAAHDLREKPDPSNVIRVKKIIQHEEYNKHQFHAHDISLLVLEREIKFSPLVSRVCLPTPQLNLEHKHVKIIGWGATVWGGRGTSVLRKVNVRVLKMDECAHSRPVPVDKPIHLCTYRTNKDACQGDSGGPVVWLDPDTNRYTLAGLVSFGAICADENPAFHADVAAHLPWIHKNIEATVPSETCTKRN